MKSSLLVVVIRIKVQHVTHYNASRKTHTHTHTAMRKRAVRVKEIIAVIILLSRSVPSQAKPRTSRRGPVDKLLHLCQKVLWPWPWREARPVLVLT